jgi:hypothetical protein
MERGAIGERIYRSCLDPLSFYKNWVELFGDQFLKAENQFLETMCAPYLICLITVMFFFIFMYVLR